MVTSYVRSVKSFITTVQGEKFPEVFKKLLPNFYSHSPRDSTQLLVFTTQKRFLSPKCIHRMTWVKNNAFLLDPEWLSSLREKTHSRPYWTVSELHERSPPPQQTASWSSSRRIWNGLGVREVIILGSRLSWTPGQHFPLCLSAKVSFWSATLNLGWCMCFLNLSAEFTPSLILGI